MIPELIADRLRARIDEAYTDDQQLRGKDVQQALTTYRNYFTQLLTGKKQRSTTVSPRADRLLDQFEAALIDWEDGHRTLVEKVDGDLDRHYRDAFAQVLAETEHLASVVKKDRLAAKAKPKPKAPPVPDKEPEPTPGPPADDPVDLLFVYQLHVTLENTSPTIWRRIQVPALAAAAEFHRILQLTFDWDESYPHAFKVGPTAARLVAPGEADGRAGTESYADQTVEDLFMRAGRKLRYEYGGNWHHVVTHEGVLAGKDGVDYPLCTEGDQAPPPVDRAAVWGVEGFATPPVTPDGEYLPDREATATDEDYDPGRFDPQEVNRRFRSRL